ncbi:MAG: CRISPR-associated helicase Cas3' [Chloroflexi bacterium]|nr:CRISPR-associated helicase Cas3' [Chloroflexota bacterium]
MKPYEHQKRVAELLLSERKSVILQAPTGSGKTLAALMPFLNAMDKGRDFPSKCIYSVPMRVLAKQFLEETDKWLRYAGRERKIKLAIQTGEQRGDPEFKSNLIFATIDQTLSRWLLFPYGMSKRQANIPAGALLSAYLVFDEFHLFDPTSTLPTTLEMLKQLKGIVPFVLMTATFSKHMLDQLAQALDAEPVTLDDKTLAAIPSQQKSRTYRVAEEKLSAAGVLDRHDKRSLVICNTVDRARLLYQDLVYQKPSGVEVHLLHSRFLPEDRSQTEENVRRLFAEGETSGSHIVVSTQAIEVGVDITSQVLHTELAPANSIIQRAGRCARYQEDVGEVIIYPLTFDPDDRSVEVNLVENPAPYVEEQSRFKLLGHTFDAFQKRDGEKLDYGGEQAVLSDVHGEADKTIINQLRADEYNHKRKMYAVMRGDSDQASDLIRNVFQQQVTIHPDPDRLKEAPFKAPSFGLHPGTLQKYAKDWCERFDQSDLECGVMYLVETPDPDESNKSVYDWKMAYDAKTLWGAPLVVVHPSLATYDSKLGFIGSYGGPWDERLDLEVKTFDDTSYGGFNYRLETYQDHIRHVHDAFVRLWPELEWGAQQLEKRFGWEPGIVRHAAEVAVLFHDVGKLNIKWQKWVQIYQAAIGLPIADESEAFAHTDYTSTNEQHREASRNKRPTHAVESALASFELMVQRIGDTHPLTHAVFTAICRHHTLHAQECQTFKLSKYSPQYIFDTLPNGWFSSDDISRALHGLNETFEAYDADDYIIQPDDQTGNGYLEGGFLAYLIIARVLRMADQLGTKEGSSSGNK